MSTRGWTVVAASALALVGVWLTNLAELLALGLAGLAVAAVAAVAARPTRAVIASGRADPDRLHVGDAARVVVEATATPARPGDVVDGRASGVSVTRRRGRVTIGYEIRPDRRGNLAVGDLVRVDPLGLTRRRQVHPPTTTLRVRPAVHRLPRLAPVATAGTAGGDDILLQLRGYQPGDDPRLVCWPASARHGTLVVRHLGADEPMVVVLLDTSVPPYPDASFEDAVRVAASFAVAAAEAGHAVEVMTTGGARASGPDEALDLLAGVERDPADGGWREPAMSVPAGAVPLLVTGRSPGTARAETDWLLPGARPPGVAAVDAHRPPCSWTVRGLPRVVAATSRDCVDRWNAEVGR